MTASNSQPADSARPLIDALPRATWRESGDITRTLLRMADAGDATAQSFFRTFPLIAKAVR